MQLSLYLGSYAFKMKGMGENSNSHIILMVSPPTEMFPLNILHRH